MADMTPQQRDELRWRINDNIFVAADQIKDVIADDVFELVSDNVFDAIVQWRHDSVDDYMAEIRESEAINEFLEPFPEETRVAIKATINFYIHAVSVYANLRMAEGL